MLRYCLAAAFVAAVVYVADRVEAPVLILVAFAFAAAFLSAVVAGLRFDDGAAAQRESRQKDLPSGFGRAILERVPSPLMVISDKGRINYANTAATQLLPNILIGDHFASLVRAPLFVEAVNATLRDGGRREVEFSLPGRDLVLEAQATRLPAGSEFGDDRQAIVRIDDRTEAHRTAETRSNFIANASHELRTPLASLIGYIETLRTHAQDDPEAQERFLGIMNKQAQRMQRLVEDLMSLSRIEMDSHVLPEDQAGLHALVREAVAGLGPVIDRSGATVDLALTGSDPMVRCDPDQIVQVVTNLTDNALKYGESPIVISNAETRGGMVGITVADQGPGIPRGDIHMLTERFFRVNVARSREAGGTGLGLAIVKHILNRHDGELQVMSDVGEGSQFSIWLPEMDPEEAEVETPRDSENAA